MDPSAVYLEHLIESIVLRNHCAHATAFVVLTPRISFPTSGYDCCRTTIRCFESIAATVRCPRFSRWSFGNLFRDYRIKRWGKWRPSAEAKRHGQTAVLLETAVYRDGRSFDDACRVLQENGRVNLDRAELRRIMAELPRRIRPREEGEASLDSVASPEHANGHALENERAEQVRSAESALRRAIAGLDPEDQLIITMHFFEAISIADIARALGLDQKPLYPRIKGLLRSLASRLASEGIGREFLESFGPPSTDG